LFATEEAKDRRKETEDKKKKTRERAAQAERKEKEREKHETKELMNKSLLILYFLDPSDTLINKCFSFDV
jgi:hypothetical protein